ncbi:hypothetical protein SAMN05216548_104113 [Faunimonas pinastri]|uniref:Uncharacterized protein n=1 Tax=Faunimonas pinastri TaxID=1855383 RepID=A0A1H9FGK5_9HYPH|nr:hypothetical protein [Faunimonas pinastri]SEQ37091.1 hypothetical protein SAMN05216548_104113 [Faunimonas pinastri]
MAIRALLFGGCLLRGPFHRIRNAERRKPGTDWDGVPEDLTFGGVPYFTYTLGEMLQTVQIYKGQRYVPREIKTLCGINHDFSPNPRVALNKIDVMLIEPNTSNEIEFEGYYLNRNRVMDLLERIRALGEAADKLAGQWFHKGVNGMNDELRRSLAEKLIDLLPDDIEDRDFLCVFLRNARGEKRDVHTALKAFLDAVDIPVGLVTFTWQYMPDGRPISWPADFYKKLMAAAHALDLPYIEPREYVTEFGIKAAMRKDFKHYTEEFQPIMAKALVQFAKDVIARGKPDGQEIGRLSGDAGEAGAAGNGAIETEAEAEAVRAGEAPVANPAESGRAPLLAASP